MPRLSDMVRWTMRRDRGNDISTSDTAEEVSSDILLSEINLFIDFLSAVYEGRIPSSLIEGMVHGDYLSEIDVSFEEAEETTADDYADETEFSQRNTCIWAYQNGDLGCTNPEVIEDNSKVDYCICITELETFDYRRCMFYKEGDTHAKEKEQ